MPRVLSQDLGSGWQLALIAVGGGDQDHIVVLSLLQDEPSASSC